MTHDRMSEVESQLAVKINIDQLDFEPIKVKLIKESNWSKNYTDAVEVWYKRFLFLVYKHTETSIVVTKPIDEFWHHHILDTRKYADDCNTVYGRFLHHFPYFGMRGDDDKDNLNLAFERTLVLIMEEYGESLLDAEISIASAQKPVGIEDPNWGSSCSDCGGPGSFGPGLMGNYDRPRLSTL